MAQPVPEQFGAAAAVEEGGVVVVEPGVVVVLPLVVVGGLPGVVVGGLPVLLVDEPPGLVTGLPLGGGLVVVLEPPLDGDGLGAPPVYPVTPALLVLTPPKALAMLVNWLDMLLPNSCKPPMEATLTRARIRPYSTRLCPEADL